MAQPEEAAQTDPPFCKSTHHSNRRAYHERDNAYPSHVECRRSASRHRRRVRLPSAAIKKAITKLDLAYPAGVANLTHGEAELRCEVYADAVSGFPSAVVVGAMKRLLLKNPRNPFAPTPQDVNELCEKLRREARGAVVGYAGGNDWRPPPWLVGCAAPWTPGCLFSADVIKGFLRAETWWRVRLAPPEGVEMPPDEAFERIPSDVFEDGQREHIAAERKHLKELAAKQAREAESDRLRREAKYDCPSDPMTNEPFKKKAAA